VVISGMAEHPFGYLAIWKLVARNGVKFRTVGKTPAGCKRVIDAIKPLGEGITAGSGLVVW